MTTEDRAKHVRRQQRSRVDGDATTSRKPSEERWAELLHVSAEVFAEKGYSGTSLQDIADRIGMLKGSLYYYINTKEDLLYEIVRNVLEEGVRRLDEVVESEGTALERLRLAILQHLGHLMRNSIETAVFLNELRHLSREKRMRVPNQRYEAMFRQLVSDAQAEGTVRSDLDAELQTRVLLGAANSIHRWFGQGEIKSPTSLSEQVADLIINGMAN